MKVSRTLRKMFGIVGSWGALQVAFSVIAVASGVYLLGTNLDIRRSANTGSLQPVGFQDGWTMVWQDEFEGNQLDTTKWSTCYYYACTGWWHLEKQWYTPQNVQVSDGTLKLIARKETVKPGDGNTYEYTSGMVQSGQTKQVTDSPKFSFQYGYLEGRIKVPEGRGFWPAFWTTGTYDHPPEIDLFEYFSNSTELSQGFWYWENGQKKSWNGGANLQGQNFANQWHVYGAEWSEDRIAFYLDGALVKEYTGSIMSQLEVHKPQHIILNFAIGASFLPSPDATTPFPATMEVDYVRVWKRGEGLQAQPSPSPLISDACSGDGIYLYTDGNYQGTCQKFTSDVPDMSTTRIKSDQVSSIKVVGEYRAVVYSDSQYKGTSMAVNTSLANMQGLSVGSDSVSSLKVVAPVPTIAPVPSPTLMPTLAPSPVPSPSIAPNPSTQPTVSKCVGKGIYLYRDTDFKGVCTKVTASHPTLTKLEVGNDSVSSVRVVNYTATAFTDGNYQGKSLKLNRSYRDLSKTVLGSDAMSSIKFE